MSAHRTRAVFFDVDFTLIYPGPTFQGAGYRRFCAQHGMTVDEALFPAAVRAASSILTDQQDHAYDADIFVRYTRRIIEEMGARGDRLDDCSREIYAEWAACQHFFLYDDVRPTLEALAADGLKIGLITNSHRSFPSFEEHFALRGLIHGAVSSADHGYLKPHPSIFESALKLLDVPAAASMMVGDSFAHDIEGARGVGMYGVLVQRARPEAHEVVPPDVIVISDLAQLPALLHR